MASKNEGLVINGVKTKKYTKHGHRYTVALMSVPLGYMRITVTALTFLSGIAMLGLRIAADSLRATNAALAFRLYILFGAMQTILSVVAPAACIMWLLHCLFWHGAVGNRTLCQWVGTAYADKNGKVLRVTPEYNRKGQELKALGNGKFEVIPDKPTPPKINHSIQELNYICAPVERALEAASVPKALPQKKGKATREAGGTEGKAEGKTGDTKE